MFPVSDIIMTSLKYENEFHKAEQYSVF